MEKIQGCCSGHFPRGLRRRPTAGREKAGLRSRERCESEAEEHTWKTPRYGGGESRRSSGDCLEMVGVTESKEKNFSRSIIHWCNMRQVKSKLQRLTLRQRKSSAGFPDPPCPQHCAQPLGADPAPGSPRRSLLRPSAWRTKPRLVHAPVSQHLLKTGP